MKKYRITAGCALFLSAALSSPQGPHASSKLSDEDIRDVEKAQELKAKISDITLEVLEKDYHHDGALPKAPPECYHVKDTFVHPATVLVLTRDDPALGEETVTGIRAEILEVLGHTEVVRQLVVY